MGFDLEEKRVGLLLKLQKVLLLGEEISGVDECVVAGKDGRCGRGF